MIYVNKDNVNFSQWMNNDKIKIQCLIELSNKINEIIDLIYYVENLVKTNSNFEASHKHIKISKEIASKNKK